MKEPLQACAVSCGVDLAEPIEVASALEAVERVVHPRQKTLVDLVVVNNDLPGYSGIQMLGEINDSEQPVRSILVAESEAEAPGALSVGVDGFVLKSAPVAEFEQMATRLLVQISRWHDESVEIRFRDQVRRIGMFNIVYAETVDHDQVIHLANGNMHAVRCSSTALFDQLSHDPRFFKAGSSSIVNLAHVRMVTTRGQVELSNGESVTVPMRLRKPMEETLMQFGLES